MLQRPAFQPHYHVEIVEGEGIVLLSEKDHSLLPGRLYEIVARWIDGRRSADDIVAQLRDQASSAEVYETLAQLEQQGFLSESDETVPAGEEAAGCDCGSVAAPVGSGRSADRLGPGGLLVLVGERLRLGGLRLL